MAVAKITLKDGTEFTIEGPANGLNFYMDVPEDSPTPTGNNTKSANRFTRSLTDAISGTAIEGGGVQEGIFDFWASADSRVYIAGSTIQSFTLSDKDGTVDLEG